MEHCNKTKKLANFEKFHVKTGLHFPNIPLEKCNNKFHSGENRTLKIREKLDFISSTTLSTALLNQEINRKTLYSLSSLQNFFSEKKVKF